MPTSTRASRSPEGSSHELVRTLRAQVARAPRRARGAADARLLRRHPRPGRPHAAATRLDLPRKVAPHVRRLRTALGRAARPLARRRRRRPPAHRPRRRHRPARRQPQDRCPGAVRPGRERRHRLRRPGRRDQVGPPRCRGVRDHRSGTGQRAPGVLGRRHQARLPPQGLARQLRHRRLRRRMGERRTRSMPTALQSSPTSAGRRTAAPWWSAPCPASCSPSTRRGRASRPSITDKARFSRHRVRAERMGGPRRQPVPRTARGRDRVPRVGAGGGRPLRHPARRIRACGRSSRPRPAVSRSSTC